MVIGQSEIHHGTDLYPAVNDHRLVYDGAYRENGIFRDIDVGRKLLGPKHAHGRQGKRTSPDVIWQEPFIPPFLDQFNTIFGNLSKTLFIDITDHRDDESIVQGHGHTHMHIRHKEGALICPHRVYDRMFGNSCSGDLHHEIGDGDLHTV